MAIIRINYKANRTKHRTRKSTSGKNRPARVQPDGVVTRYAARAVWYCTYGRTPEQQVQAPAQQRGVWYDPTGRACSYEAVHAWTKENTRTHKYLYSIILSTGPESKIPMQPSDWVTVMHADERFPEWRLIPHHDTQHTHAHVITWSDKVLSRSEHARWHERVQAQLATLESERVRELDRTREQTVEQSVAPTHARARKHEQVRTHEPDLSL